MSLLVFTATCDDGPRPETMASIRQQTFRDYDHEVSWLDDPLPGRHMENVVAQYQKAQAMCLAGRYDALLTVEHDMILPPDAVAKLWNTDSPVVYGVYMLRHGTATLNAWQYCGNKNMGMSLSLYPQEVKKARKQGWIEVSGTGWGCTLIRRPVLERLTVHSNSKSDAGDITFSTDCLRAGIRQIARFDVPCGHIEPSGNVLEVFRNGGIVARVLALVDFNARVGAESVPMKKGRYYTVPPEDGMELARAGYVRITNDDDSQEEEGEREQPGIAARELAINPKARGRNTRAKKAK